MSLREFVKDARFLAECPALLKAAVQQNAELKQENAELRRINLELGRACLNLCYGLITEINDPGTLSEDHILAAATDWADQIARMEEHTV